MAKKNIEETGASAPLSLQDRIAEFFEANPFYNSIIVTEDGAIFENSPAGMNAAMNYADSMNPKLSYEIHNR